MTQNRTSENLECLVEQLYREGRHTEAAHVAAGFFELTRLSFGDGHPKTATSLNDLGFMLRAAGDWARARQCYEQALTMRRNA